MSTTTDETRRATPESLVGQLAAVDRLLTTKRLEAEQGALDAVESPKKADALSRVVGDIKQMEADRGVLRDALAAAQRRADNEKVKDDAQRCSQARAKAATHAAETVVSAQRVDGLMSDLLAALADLQAAENATRAQAQIAGGILSISRIGQRGAGSHALGLLQRIASDDRTGNARSTADLCRNGWSDLLETSDSREVAQ